MVQDSRNEGDLLPGRHPHSSRVPSNRPKTHRFSCQPTFIPRLHDQPKEIRVVTNPEIHVSGSVLGHRRNAGIFTGGQDPRSQTLCPNIALNEQANLSGHSVISGQSQLCLHCRPPGQAQMPPSSKSGPQGSLQFIQKDTPYTGGQAGPTLVDISQTDLIPLNLS